MPRSPAFSRRGTCPPPQCRSGFHAAIPGPRAAMGVTPTREIEAIPGPRAAMGVTPTREIAEAGAAGCCDARLLRSTANGTHADTAKLAQLPAHPWTQPVTYWHEHSTKC